jgi:hypothetical protein
VTTFDRFMRNEEIKSSSFVIISLPLSCTQRNFIFHISVEKSKSVNVTTLSLTLEMVMKLTALSSQELVIPVSIFLMLTSLSKSLPTLVPEDKKPNVLEESFDPKKVRRNKPTPIKTSLVHISIPW